MDHECKPCGHVGNIQFGLKDNFEQGGIVRLMVLVFSPGTCLSGRVDEAGKHTSVTQRQWLMLLIPPQWLSYIDVEFNVLWLSEVKVNDPKMTKPVFADNLASDGATGKFSKTNVFFMSRITCFNDFWMTFDYRRYLTKKTFWSHIRSLT